MKDSVSGHVLFTACGVCILLTIVAVLGLALSPQTFAQEVVNEDSGDGAVLPGELSILYETCVVGVLNRTASPQFDGTFTMQNVPVGGGPVRARITCRRGDGTTVSGQSDLVSLTAGGSSTFGSFSFGNVAPITDALILTASKSALTGVGDTTQLTVTGLFDNSTQADVTAAPDIVYRTSNPLLATVSSTGLVRAVSSGTVVVSAAKDGVIATRVLQVSAGPAGDADGDGLPDAYEVANGLNPNDPSDASLDLDGDGLTNLQEFQLGTNPRLADTDGDGIPDGVEVSGSNGFVTNPLLADTDGDGIRDGLEIQTGTDPTNPASFSLTGTVSTLQVTPAAFTLTVNTVLVQDVLRQLIVSARLIDGTTLDLTAAGKGTTYRSSNLAVCNFGATAGRVFAGQNGTCTITVSNSGFTATATGTVRTFAPTALSFISIPGFANNVDVSGNYAYVAAGSAGLQVVDVSNHSSPRIVASLDTPGNANDVKVVGPRAYVADGSAGLQVIDISNPTLPRFLGFLDTPGEAYDVAVSGNHVFIADGPSGLQIIDITNPTTPKLLGSVDTPGTAKGVAVSGTVAVVADGANGVQIIDVSSPASPRIVGTLDTPGDARDVAVNGLIAYVADYTGGLRIVDFTVPTSPTLVSAVPTTSGGVLMDVAHAGTLVFGADVVFVNGVPITDVSSPVNPIVRARLDFPERDDNGAGIAVDSQHVYLTASRGIVENGVTEDTRLYIGQYVDLEDTGGIAPTVRIEAPAYGDTVVEGATISIAVSATDDVHVASVDVVVDGQVVFTDSAAPYQFNFTVPVGVRSLTLSATAVDLGGNVGLANDVRINVIPDPGTTVVGRVLSSNGNPISGATVSTFGERSATTGTDGAFSLSGVPTALGNIVVTANAVVNGLAVSGRSAAVPPVVGGVTNVGDIRVVACAVPAANLISCWKGEGNTTDATGAANGTLQGGTTFAPGKVGQAFQFDGLDDSVSFGHTVGNFGTADFTIDFWVKTTSARREAILGKRPICSHEVFWQIRLWDGGRLLVELDQGGANYNFILTTRTVNNGMFRHVAIVRQGPKASVYIDGVLDTTGTTAGVTNLANAVALVAGREPCTGVDGTQFLTGLLDEIELTNRALTAGEIQNIFLTGSIGP